VDDNHDVTSVDAGTRPHTMLFIGKGGFADTDLVQVAVVRGTNVDQVAGFELKAVDKEAVDHRPAPQSASPVLEEGRVDKLRVKLALHLVATICLAQPAVGPLKPTISSEMVARKND